jgi:hypothetical protein
MKNPFRLMATLIGMVIGHFRHPAPVVRKEFGFQPDYEPRPAHKFRGEARNGRYRLNKIARRRWKTRMEKRSRRVNWGLL